MSKLKITINKTSIKKKKKNKSIRDNNGVLIYASTTWWWSSRRMWALSSYIYIYMGSLHYGACLRQPGTNYGCLGGQLKIGGNYLFPPSTTSDCQYAPMNWHLDQKRVSNYHLYLLWPLPSVRPVNSNGQRAMCASRAD